MLSPGNNDISSTTRLQTYKNKLRCHVHDNTEFSNNEYSQIKFF